MTILQSIQFYNRKYKSYICLQQSMYVQYTWSQRFQVCPINIWLLNKVNLSVFTYMTKHMRMVSTLQTLNLDSQIQQVLKYFPRTFENMQKLCKYAHKGKNYNVYKIIGEL